MNSTLYTPRLSSLSLASSQAWMLSLAFIAGNIILPQIAHLIPQGGLIFLPIYFFTLVAAYKYGMQVGVLTAVASPMINSLVFGMPAFAMLPIIIFKGVLLAIIAGYMAKRLNKAPLIAIAMVVIAYQTFGCAIEAIAYGSFTAGFQDCIIGLPGMLIQIFGGWLLINWLPSRR